MGVAEKHSLPGDRVDRGRADHVVETAGAVDLSEQRGVATPVVSKQKQDVGLLAGLGRLNRPTTVTTR